LARNRDKSSKIARIKKSVVGVTPATSVPDETVQRARSSWSKPAIWLGVLGAAAIVFLGGLAFQLLTGSPFGTSSGRLGSDAFAAATFVGSESCSGCHRAEADLWSPSQHKLAMQHASDKSVLGNFNDARFDYFGVHSRFFRRDGKFLVETDGPDGKLTVFEVKYTFGLDPLQQYLIEFPDGRVQALSLAWDSRPTDKGGQRWFHLYPNEEIKNDDILHWTKLNQNWNFMCAECHSTGVRKNYDAVNDRFATAFSEIRVGLRGLSWTGVSPRCLGARPTKLVAIWKDRRPYHGTSGALYRAARRNLVA